MEGKRVLEVEDEDSIYVPLSNSRNRISHVSLTLCYMGPPGFRRRPVMISLCMQTDCRPKKTLLLAVSGWEDEAERVKKQGARHWITAQRSATYPCVCKNRSAHGQWSVGLTLGVMAALFKEKGTTVTAHGIMTGTITDHRHHHHYRRNQPHSREPNRCSPQRCKLSTCWAAAGHDWELSPPTPRLLARHKSRFLLILEEI